MSLDGSCGPALWVLPLDSGPMAAPAVSSAGVGTHSSVWAALQLCHLCHRMAAAAATPATKWAQCKIHKDSLAEFCLLLTAAVVNINVNIYG